MIPESGNQRTSISPPERVLYSVKEAAHVLGVTDKTVWHLIYDKELTATRLRRRVLVHRDDLTAYIDGLTKTTTPPASRAAVAA